MGHRKNNGRVKMIPSENKPWYPRLQMNSLTHRILTKRRVFTPWAKRKPYLLHHLGKRGREYCSGRKTLSTKRSYGKGARARTHRNWRICASRFRLEELSKYSRGGEKIKHDGCFERDWPCRTLALWTSPPSPHAHDPAATAGTPGRHAGNCLGTVSRTWKPCSEGKTRKPRVTRALPTAQYRPISSRSPSGPSSSALPGDDNTQWETAFPVEVGPMGVVSQMLPGL